MQTHQRFVRMMGVRLAEFFVLRLPALHVILCIGRRHLPMREAHVWIFFQVDIRLCGQEARARRYFGMLTGEEIRFLYRVLSRTSRGRIR